MYYSCVYRSPPRTRRSSTSSTGSSGNGGYSGGLNLTSGGLATAKRASRRRSRSPSPRPSAKLSAPAVDAGRRSRSPTPRANGTAADRLSARQNAGGSCRSSRSVTPCGRSGQERRSASPFVGGDLLAPNRDRLRTSSSGGGGDRSRSPSAAGRVCVAGVDDTPTPKISLNFATSEHPAVEFCGDTSADRPQRPPQTERCGDEVGVNGGDDVAVDTSSTCRVSDNFRGTELYRVLNDTPVQQAAVVERRHSTVREEESEVDTTPFCRVSDSLRVQQPAPQDCPSAASAGRKKSSSSGRYSSRDAKRSEPVGTDSGSEVSDEGYRSLGIVTSPPAAIASAKTALQKFNGKRTIIIIH